MKTRIAEFMPVTGSYLPAGFCMPGPGDMVDSLVNVIEAAMEAEDLPLFISDLARVEWAAREVKMEDNTGPRNPDTSEVNPTLDLLAVDWRGLPGLLADGQKVVVPAEMHVAVFKPYGGRQVRILEMSGHDLLALKIIAEELDVCEVAETAGTSVAAVENILAEAGRKGLIYLPPSRLLRDPAIFGEGGGAQAETGMHTEVFTLQWHLTQKCDLHCRHCYDRSGRLEMTIEQTESILDQLQAFCEQHRVAGQVSFSGGNPLLYPHFDHVYRQAAERGFMTTILGNPSPRKQLEGLVAIKRPEFFQVSLEGMEEHNDFIRGRGHFRRTLVFLDVLRKFGIYSMVMLTLTRSNMKEVLPLAECLRDKTDRFNFNRLSPVGEGAALESIPVASYRDFLEKYLQAAAENPIMGLKDNLFNIILEEEGNKPLTGGCTGFGCGAAFNFVSLLPDGEVHACRKLQSLLGNIHNSTLGEIYHSEMARKYRSGASGCRGCRIRRFCGGCLAVVQGSGGDPCIDVDPYCFIKR